MRVPLDDLVADGVARSDLDAVRVSVDNSVVRGDREDERVFVALGRAVRAGVVECDGAPERALYAATYDEYPPSAVLVEPTAYSVPFTPIDSGVTFGIEDVHSAAPVAACSACSTPPATMKTVPSSALSVGADGHAPSGIDHRSAPSAPLNARARKTRVSVPSIRPTVPANMTEPPPPSDRAENCSSTSELRIVGWGRGRQECVQTQRRRRRWQAGALT